MIYLEQIKKITGGILNSYSQVFFSDNRVFACLILLVTFLDIWAGTAGLLAVLTTIFIGYTMGYDKETISRGYYGFNALLVGLGLGIYYEPGLAFFLIVILSAVFTFFITLMLQGFLTKYSLPYLSIPFLFGIWVTGLATQHLHSLEISQRSIYTLNYLYSLGGKNLVDFYNWLNTFDIPIPLKIYFKSLGAIFFQYKVLAGIILAFGILYYSRIAFTLSVIGFSCAYLFYTLTGAPLTETDYSYIGFNYILTSIAIGGFFIIPSRGSFFWSVILIPMVAVLTISLSTVFIVFHLPVYSLPFNITVLLFLYALKFRISQKGKLTEVLIQQFTPEKNLYAYLAEVTRFGHSNMIRIRLPFFGEWSVSQGHDGEYTHKGEWKHAWDFIITDESENQFRKEGNEASDYYCYEKAVLSPAIGIIEEVTDNIPDNAIGEVNLEQNWGNTIVIKHADFLYSNLSHLKNGSIKVKPGDKVEAGQQIAQVGNSGRSPYPHLHFQVQSTPFTGSKTLDYPLSYYIEHQEDNFKLHSFDRPEKDQRISNIQVNKLIKRAFHFIPGKKIIFEVSADGTTKEIVWEVVADVYNNAYLTCSDSNSRAYFLNDGNVFYFTSFTGDKTSLLYFFYLGAYKIQSGFYQGLTLTDNFPLDHVFKKRILFFQDFVAPFYLFLKATYEIHYEYIDDKISSSKIVLKSEIQRKFFKKILHDTKFEIELGDQGLKVFKVFDNKKIIEATCKKD